MLKKKVKAIRCKLSQNQEGAYDDEFIISMNGKYLCMKKRYIFVEEEVKRDILGIDWAYIHPDGVLSITGPNCLREYLIRLNSRGYMEQFFVKDTDLVWNEF